MAVGSDSFSGRGVPAATDPSCDLRRSRRLPFRAVLFSSLIIDVVLDETEDTVTYG